MTDKCTENDVCSDTPKCDLALWRSQVIEDVSRVLYRHEISHKAHINLEHDLILIDLREK
jgi:hypothetical protein